VHVALFAEFERSEGGIDHVVNYKCYKIYNKSKSIKDYWRSLGVGVGVLFDSLE
jgi:hypothetical protein